MASDAMIGMIAPMESPAPVSRADKAGVALSVACGVHCLLTPILLLALPTVGEAFHNPIIHKLIALGVTAIAGFALWRGYRRHGHRLPLIIGSIGVATVWSALAVPHETHDHDHFHLPVGTIITMIGSLLLITGHVLNIHNCRKGCCHNHSSKSA